MIQRDIQLDNYRALIMIHMVCVIHVIYWLCLFFPDNSFVLFGMSSVFFISGVSMRYSSPKNNASLIWNRFKRVLLPYYVYACVCVFILFMVLFIPKLYFATKYSICDYKITDFLKILFVQTIPGIKMVFHIWFIIPYLIITCTFNYQKKILNKYSWKYVLCNILLISFLFFAKIYEMDYLHFSYINRSFYDTSLNVLAYNIFFIIGYLYYKRLNLKILILIAFISFFLLAILSNFTFPDLQTHKIPPDIIFVLYNIGVLCLFGILFSKIEIPNNKLLNWWNKNGYTIYLYQNLVFLFYQKTILTYISIFIGNVYFKIIVSTIIIFIMSTLLSMFTVPFENKVMNLLLHKKNYDV